MPLCLEVKQLLDLEAPASKESMSPESCRALRSYSHQLKNRVGRKREWLLKNEPVVSLGVQIPAEGWDGGYRATEITEL